MAFLHFDAFERIADSVLKKQMARHKTGVSTTAEVKAKLAQIKKDQQGIIAQISQRAAEGRRPLSALDDMLDKLEEQKEELENVLARAKDDQTKVSDEDRLRQLRQEINPETVETILNAAVYLARDHADTATKQPFVDIIRQLVQKVVILKTPGRQPADLEVHGRIASILAAVETAQMMEMRFRSVIEQHVLARELSGEIDTEDKKQKLLAGYAEELSRKRLEWQQIQVSVVAGAGFEPAAFRL